MERDMGTTIATKTDMQLLSTSMTVRLGSMLVVGFGVMIAILRLLPD
jgi:hypothetical protein